MSNYGLSGVKGRSSKKFTSDIKNRLTVGILN